MMGLSIAGLALAFMILLFPGVRGQSDTKPETFPFQPAKDTFQPTVLDASQWIEAPTGKHGFLTRKGDQFIFADGTPARFWGAQMDVLPKAQVDYTVRRMRRQGINITRVHGLEFLNNHQGKTSFDYDPQAWDRLDYLISKLGENGIYIILDVDYPLIYRFKPGDNIPGFPEGGATQSAEFFDEKVASILHQRMTDVFTHGNPYTGKRYADDPTIALVEVLNEDSLFFGLPDGPPFLSEFERKYSAWLRAKYRDNDGLRRAWTVDGKWPLAEGQGIAPGQSVPMLNNTDFTEGYLKEHAEQRLRGIDQLRFCAELETAYWGSSTAVLRQAGARVPIAGTNWQGFGFTTRVHMHGQATLDYVDRHGYWDHPEGEGDLRWKIKTAMFHNLPMIKEVDPQQDKLVYLGVENLVTEKAWEQVLDHPMTISEWNTCLPNGYSLEGTGLMAAYGLLQGWGGLLEFGYFSPDFRDALGDGSFDLFGNPPQILQFPAVATMWYRQDIQEAGVVAESLYDPETLYQWTEDRKPVPLWGALVGKVGYRFVDRPQAPVVKDLSPYWDAKTMTARSITGELTWNASVGVVHIDTARTQAVIGFLSTEPHRLGAVSLISPSRFGALYVTAMDGMAPIRSARRLLITAVGPAQNTDMEYEETKVMSRLGSPLWRLKSEGHGPALLEAITGELRIRLDKANKLQCWTLDVTGKRLHTVPIKVESDELVLNMQASDRTVYYELTAP